MDKETIQILLDLLNPLHGEIDRQTYDERYRQAFDAPDDAEYTVDITARMERDLCQAVIVLEARQRDIVSNPAAHSFIDALNAAKLEYSGLSWAGKNVFGDRKSIEEVRHLTQLGNYTEALREQGQRYCELIAELREENKQLRARLDRLELERDPPDSGDAWTGGFAENH